MRIKCPTHYAVIYYTTDGWTPTTASTRYTGPIEVNGDTAIQAIAIAPNLTKSIVSRAQYKVAGNNAATAVMPVATDGVLHAGTLSADGERSGDSKTAQVGDKLTLRLEQDVMVGDRVAIAKGTTVEATITHADPSRHIGVPGDLVFEVHDLVADGLRIPLEGGETLEGPDHYRKTFGMAMVPVVGFGGVDGARVGGGDPAGDAGDCFRKE